MTRVPVNYDRVLRPEWIDYALEQSVQTEDQAELTEYLVIHLSEVISSATSLRKTVRQLLRVVGFLSPIPRSDLFTAYEAMRKVEPSQRKRVRLGLLVRSTPFVSDVVDQLRKLKVLGVKGVEAQQLYERMIERYGDRGTIPRRVRYVLCTLANLGLLENHSGKWFIKAEFESEF